MSPRKEDHSLMCSHCKEKTTEIWFSEKGTPLCLICFSTERFEKIDETPVGTPRKTLNSNPVLRMCSLIEQKLGSGEKRKRNKSAVSKLDKEEKVIDDATSSSVVAEEPVEKEQNQEDKPDIESRVTELKVEEKEENNVDEGLKKSLRRKKKLHIPELLQQNKKPRVERVQREKPPADPQAKSRRSIFKQKVFKSPDPVPSVFTSDVMYFKGTYFRKGDIVSLTDIDGGIFYAQLRGFMQDQYCEKSAAITWLLPTDDAPPPEEGFDPDYYVFGPEEDLPRKLEYMTFVMHAPSNYFYDRSLPYPEYPAKGAIYGRLHPMKRVICHTALQKNEIQIPECIEDRKVDEVIEVKDEMQEVDKDQGKEESSDAVKGESENFVNGPHEDTNEVSSCNVAGGDVNKEASVESKEGSSDPIDAVMSETSEERVSTTSEEPSGSDLVVGDSLVASDQASPTNEEKEKL